MNKNPNKKVSYQDLGVIGYEEAWDYQEQLLKSIVEVKVANRTRETPTDTKNHLLFCEHPHVYTIGKSGDQDHLLLGDSQLEKKNVQFFRTNRGGDITYHGPGQLVGYPVLDLENFYTDIHRYLRDLEESIMKTLEYFEIPAGKVEGLTGVWVDVDSLAPRKICAMGVRTSRWVTMHGFALNINTDLSYFDNIVPCGIADKGVTSIQQELGSKVSVEEVKKVLLKRLTEVFGFRFISLK